jgi:hypothetical protein
MLCTCMLTARQQTARLFFRRLLVGDVPLASAGHIVLLPSCHAAFCAACTWCASSRPCARRMLSRAQQRTWLRSCLGLRWRGLVGGLAAQGLQDCCHQDVHDLQHVDCCRQDVRLLSSGCSLLVACVVAATAVTARHNRSSSKRRPSAGLPCLLLCGVAWCACRAADVGCWCAHVCPGFVPLPACRLSSHCRRALPPPERALPHCLPCATWCSSPRLCTPAAAAAGLHALLCLSTARPRATDSAPACHRRGV